MGKSFEETELPIETVVPQVKDALATRSLAVLTAEPGAGKTTIIPLRLFEEPWLEGRRILILEPRRLAARACAQRMASLLGESLGETVGVTTRDFRRTSKNTRIEVVTEGVLTARLQNDPELEGVGLVIFDEFHERNLQGDLGLALMLDAKRGFDLDIAILVMSATIDAQSIAELIAGKGQEPAPVIECAGRTHPIELHWKPVNKNRRLAEQVAEVINWALSEFMSGDLLVFLPGMGDINRVYERLSTRSKDPWGSELIVHRLHGSLAIETQNLATEPDKKHRRKVVLSTDIAESSITVQGVSIVVDSGLARSPRFDPATGISRLQTVSISRASADQRAGRAGRLGPGVAIRMWSRIEHGTRVKYSPSELLSGDLASLCLELKNWGVNSPDSLEFLDRVPPAAWKTAIELLEQLGAIDHNHLITERGVSMSRLPLHPRLAAVVTEAKRRSVGWLGCLAAVCLDDRDVFNHPISQRPVSLDERIRAVENPNTWIEHGQKAVRRNARKRALELARRAGIKESSFTTSELGVVMAAGFGDRIAQRRENQKGSYLLRNGSGALLSPQDEMASEKYLVAISVEGKKQKARITMAAALDYVDIQAVASGEIDVRETVKWDKERKDVAVVRRESLGAINLGVHKRRAKPGKEVTALLCNHVRETKLQALPWTKNAKQMVERVAFLKNHLGPEGDDWPDLSDDALIKNLEEWLAPMLAGAQGLADLETLSLMLIFDSILGYDKRRELDRLVPTHIQVGKRRLAIDYSGEFPLICSKAQDFFLLRSHPCVIDSKVKVVIDLLSPANRPIQRTSDIIGFWNGSWEQVRKELGGRYPKHDWPKHPHID